MAMDMELKIVNRILHLLESIPQDVRVRLVRYIVDRLEAGVGGETVGTNVKAD